MPALNAVTTADDYEPAGATLEGVAQSSGGFYNVQGADVFCEVEYGDRFDQDWTDEVHLSAGTVGVLPEGVIGIRFRSYTPATPATVTAALFLHDQPAFQIGAGSGAPPVTVLTGIFNVQTFGAKGNGSGDDTHAIQAAINAAEASSTGGVVYLPPGLYPIAAPLLIQQSNVTMIGAGAGNIATPQGTSVIRALSSFSGSAMLIVQSTTPAASSLDNVTLRDFELDGFGAGSPFANCDGIVWGVYRGRIQNVNVWRVQQDGLVVDGGGSFVFPLGAWDNLIVNCNIGTIGGNGMHFQGVSSDNTVEACIVGPCGGNSIQIEQACPGQRILDCYLQTATGYHVYALEVGQLEVIGCRLRESNGGVALVPTQPEGIGFVVADNTFKNCSEAADNTTDGILVAPSGSGSISGGLIGGNNFATSDSKRMRYAVNVANTAVSDLVVSSQGYSFLAPATDCYGTAALQNLGTRTRVEPITLAQNAVQASHTGDLLETVLATITVPGGLIGANGRLRVNAVFSRNSGGTSTISVRARFSGSAGAAYLNATMTTAQLVDGLQTEIANRNAQNSQVGMAAVGLGAGGFLVTSAVDTSQDQTLVLTGQLGSAGDTVNLESFAVAVLPG